MESEWNLSDKQMDSAQATCQIETEDIPVYLETDVKEFIRRLKARLDEINDGEWFVDEDVAYLKEQIDKLAGSALI